MHCWSRLENLGQVRKWGRVVAAALAVKVRLYLTEGRITEGSACLNRLERLAAEYSAPTRCAWSDIRDYTLLARALLGSAQNRLKDTIAILQALRQDAEAANNGYFALRLATQLSGALLAADEPGEASHVFHEVLSLAAPAGFYQTILDEGPEIGTLLLRFQENARRTGVSGDLLPYVGNLIVGWRELYQPDLTANPASKVVESLSPRERNILERIAQAVSRAQSLGLVRTTSASFSVSGHGSARPLRRIPRPAGSGSGAGRDTRRPMSDAPAMGSRPGEARGSRQEPVAIDRGELRSLATPTHRDPSRRSRSITLAPTTKPGCQPRPTLYLASGGFHARLRADHYDRAGPVTHRTHARGTRGADLMHGLPEGGLRDKAANPPCQATASMIRIPVP